MITQHAMIAPLVAALPELAPRWDAFVAAWHGTEFPGKTHPDDLPSDIFMGKVAPEVVAGVQAGDGDFVAIAYAVTERWLTEGDPCVKEAAAIGLPEDIHNLAVHHKVPEADQTVHLGPEGRLWWDRLNGFWGQRARTQSAPTP